MANWIFTNPEDLSQSPTGQPWAQFVLDTLRGGQEYDAASPWPDRVPLLPWSSDKADTQPFITQYVWDIAPYLSDEHLKDFSPEDQDLLKGWAAGTKENSLHKDSFSPFGDQFFGALMGLGLATGGAAAYGAFAPAAAGAAGATGAGGAGAAGAGALGAGELGLEATFPYAASAAAPAAAGGAGVAGSAIPIGYLGTTGASAAGGISAAGAIPATTTAGSLLGALGLGGGGSLGYLPLVTTGISGLASLIGGIQGASAARHAADTQAQSAREANQLIANMYAQNRADLEPYRALGYASLGDLIRQAGQPMQRPRFNAMNYGGYGAPPGAGSAPTGLMSVRDVAPMNGLSSAANPSAAYSVLQDLLLRRG